MEKIMVIGPYTRQMVSSMEKYLPQGTEMVFLKDDSQYDALDDADYIILRTYRLDQPQIARLRKTKLIQRWGAGYDTVDIQAAGAHGIPVAVCAGVNAQSVAELSVLMMLALYRNLLPQAAAFASGEDRRTSLASRSRCIEGKTVGILGMGNIGRRVAGIVRGFGAEVIYYDVIPMDPEKEAALGCRYGTMDEVLSQSDIVSLHLPLLEETKGIFDRNAFEKMKPGAVLINAARQELVVEADLAEALRSGKLLGAGLDEIGEPMMQSPFAGMENVICTPHIGGSTVDINDTMARLCMEHIDAIRGGKALTPPSLVNGKYLK